MLVSHKTFCLFYRKAACNVLASVVISTCPTAVKDKRSLLCCTVATYAAVSHVLPMC
jgi:hypothetical protein